MFVEIVCVIIGKIRNYFRVCLKYSYFFLWFLKRLVNSLEIKLVWKEFDELESFFLESSIL